MDQQSRWLVDHDESLAPRRELATDAARFAELGIRSLLACGFSLNGRACGYLALCSSQPRAGWDVNLHLLLKLVGASFATGLERLRVQRHRRAHQQRGSGYQRCGTKQNHIT